MKFARGRTLASLLDIIDNDSIELDQTIPFVLCELKSSKERINKALSKTQLLKVFKLIGAKVNSMDLFVRPKYTIKISRDHP